MEILKDIASAWSGHNRKKTIPHDVSEGDWKQGSHTREVVTSGSVLVATTGWVDHHSNLGYRILLLVVPHWHTYASAENV